MSSNVVVPPLSQGFGYGIILGLGAAFCIGMVFTTWALKRSSAVAYNYGVSGPFWYASGATVQVLLFATLAIELKRKSPNAHTFLEVIKARYGVVTHAVYITFGLVTNILVTAMLLTGGSAVVSDLTGVPTAAACFLLPIGVVLYTMFGGIKATFLTDYVHTVMIFIILFVFAFTAYATNEVLGSPKRVYELLVKAAETHPVAGNAGGSYLTMRSREGAIFFVINLVGNFGTVFLDNGYYNKAIAAGVSSALPGYVMGGLAWFAIPWLCATTMGLAAVALESNPVFPTYPNRLPAAQVSAGLVLPNAAVAMLGKGGAGASLLLIFMAVTSAMSAELIAVSSIFTYDIYQGYINPKADGKILIRMSHATCVVYSIIMAGFSTGLFYAGIGMGYIYLMMGCIISSAVLPATLTLMWKDQNWIAAALSPVLGLIVALIAWLVTAKTNCGSLDVLCTGSNNPMLAGNVAALCSPLIFIPVLTFAFGKQNYDWVSMWNIRKVDDSAILRHSVADPERRKSSAVNHHRAVVKAAAADAESDAEQAKLKKSALIARSITVFMALALIILWPMPMYGSAYIFSEKFFTGWVSVGILWLFCSTAAVGIFPLIQGRKTFGRTVKSMVLDAFGKWRPPVYEGENDESDEVSFEREKEMAGKVG
ncbi:urea active transporter 1 [Physcia stellaris]|nr:urea active transporter 1 [Physcia stellaris]